MQTQKIINLVNDVFNNSEIEDEDVIQDTYLWAIQNQSELNRYTDDFIKDKIKVHINDIYNKDSEIEFEEYEDIYPSYDTTDDIDKCFTSECIRDACRKLSNKKQYIIYHNFGFGNTKPLSLGEISLKIGVPLMAIAAMYNEAINDLKEILMNSL